jgi:urease accessory protein
MTLFSPFEKAHLENSSGPAHSGSGRRLECGRLDLEFASSPDGRTYLGRQYATHPFHVCRVQFHDSELPGLATLYIQSSSGGLYEDDHHDVRIVGRDCAEAHVSTQASAIVHSMPSGRAQQHVRIEAQNRAYLEYLPDPQILFPSSRCISTIGVSVADGATALVSDSFLQHDPDGADQVFSGYFSEIKIEDDAGKTLAIDRLRLDGRTLQVRRPGTTGSFAAQGTFIVARVGSLPESMLTALQKIRFDYRDVAIGVSVLPKAAGLIVRILAADGDALRRAMHASWCATRHALKGAPPKARRK